MEIILVLLILVIVFICVIIPKTLWRNRDKALGAQLPGPKSLPVIGNVLDLNFQSLHLSVFHMVKTYGAIFQIKFFGRTAVIINDVELVRKAFSSPKYGDNFNDRPDAFFGKYIAFDCNDIGFAKINKKTKIKRKMFHRALQFYGDGIKHFEETAAVELERIIEELRRTGQHDFDLGDILRVSFAKTTITLMTGELANTDDTEAVLKFNDIGNHFLSSMSFVYEILPIVRLLPGRFGKMFREAVAARDRFLDKFYNTIRGCVNDTGERGDEVPGFVKRLIRFQDEINKRADTDIITETDLKGIIVDIVFAATDTTTNVLCITFALLITHPNVAKKIQNEIERVVGSARMPRSSDRDDMPYTMATIFEVFRYTTAVAPLIPPHRALEDQNFEGYFIEKHSIILTNRWYINHDPQLWENPWVFDPERFLDSDGLLLSSEHPTRRNLLAFSVGHRSCPGETFGKSRVFLYLTSILQSFSIIPASDEELPKTDPRDYQPDGIVLKVKKYLCRAIPRM